MDRDAALADFEASRMQWETAFARVPGGALTYLKPGDDYALGGLQVHVNWVLERYGRILQRIIATGFQPTGPPDLPGEASRARERARRGLLPAERRQALDEMAHLHAGVRARCGELPASDWSRKAAVVYEVDEDPLQTSPEDLVRWLTEHYREHVEQSADLIEEWRASREPI